ncbi:ras-domain-containing protein [Ascobolus immersus RN42]|uniref:Ras-domain-containing protein n=1 Tax=Ascobolus immersus RN42 TaxID=1160509 RepID=A0A3N4IEX4_ASCIM|nr:ras-domain-containing protein [Ascobolus immersus RN42]
MVGGGNSGSQPWDYIAKIVSIGDSAAGKTSLTIRLCEGRFQTDHNVTIGVEFGSRTIEVASNPPKRIKLQIWDTAGQETFRAITKSYFRGATGALLVYDITRRNTFISCISWLHELRQSGEPHMSIILVGNKSDLAAQRQVSTAEAQAWADSQGLHAFVETSAKTGEEVEKAFVSVATEIYENIKKGVWDLKDKNTGVRENTAKTNMVLEDGVKPASGGRCC